MSVIAIVDHTTKGTFTEMELERLTFALRYQALYQFNRSPWVEHGYCGPINDVQLAPASGLVEGWVLELLDTSDQPGALGYHEDQAFKSVTPAGKPAKASGRSSRGWRTGSPGWPLMKVFVKTCREDGVQPSEVCSHEMLEAAVDPQVMSESQVRKYLNTVSNQYYIAEVGDPVQGEGYDVGTPEGRPCNVPEATVANFAYPAWWDQPQTRPELDFRGSRKAAFELSPGGYMSVAPTANPTGWTQIYGQAHSNAGTAPSAPLSNAGPVVVA